MVSCKFCNEQNLEWYQLSNEKWKLGIKIDINNFRLHMCSPKKEESNNSRNWVSFICEKCGNYTKQNIKLIKSTTLNYCLDCNKSDA